MGSGVKHPPNVTQNGHRVLFTRGCLLPAGAFYPRVLFTRGCFLPAGAFYPRVLFTRRDRETRHVLSQSLP